MKLLVSGSSEVDAGKTTFTTGLVERTGVRGYKPRAGNGYWYDHDDYQRAVEAGRLYGKDAKRLAAAAPADVRPETINPVHRLWVPSPDGGTGILGRSDRSFAIDRVTLDGSDTYVTNGTISLPQAAERAFQLGDAPTVESLPELNALMADRHATALDDLGREIAERTAAVVESYADIARPLRDFVPDAVAVVEPGRARVYDGERYARSCEVASGSAHEGRLEERVEHVVDLLDPVASVDLPALSGAARRDRSVVADAYEEAYDELLAAV